MSNNAKHFIAVLGKAVGIEPLVLDADGALALQVSDAVDLHFQHDGKHDHLTLFVPLGTVAAADLKALYAGMLRANRFWRGTLGATLSLDEQEPPGAVLAMRLACAGLKDDDFLDAVEHILDAARDWMSHISSGGDQPAAVDPAPHDFMRFRV